MGKVDLKKTLDIYKAHHHKFRIVEVLPIQYLMIDGHGDPNTSKEFADAISTLYPVAYKIKFDSKKNLDNDYAVMPLEALWWADDMSTFTTTRDKSKWSFTLMIMQPDWITKNMFESALEKLNDKIPSVQLQKIRFERLDEGHSVQTLHIGSFDEESAILQELHTTYIPENGLQMSGRHHEIYFSDFRKVPADKLRTLLRQPVNRV